MAGTAGAIKAGRAFVEFFTDTTKFAAGLNTVQNRLNKISSSIAMTGAKLTAVGSAGVAGFLPAIKAASDLQESLNVFGVVFKDNTATMRDWTAATAAALGRAESQLIQFSSRTAAQLQGFGFTDAMSADMSKALSTLAVDLASFYNTADQDALDAILSAFRGEADPIERYNVNVKEAAVNTKLLQNSIDPSKATDLQKAYARYAIILEQTTLAQGDAVRTADGYANQLKRLQSNAKTLGETIGGALLGPLSTFYAQVSKIATSTNKWIAANPALVKSVAIVGLAIAGLGAALVTLAALGVAAGIGLKVLTAPFSLIATTIGLVVPLLSALLTPIGLVVAAIAVLGSTFVQYIGGLQPFFDWFRAQFEEVVGAARQAVTGIMAALERGDFAAALEVALSGMDVQLTTAIGSMKIAWSGFTSYFKEAFAKAAYALPVIMLGVSAQLQKGFARLQASLAGTAVANVNNAAKQEANRQFDALEERLRQLRDSGSISESDFESRLSALQTARTADMSEAEKRAAQDQSNIDKQRIAEINKINAAAKTELDALRTQMDADVSAIRGETDGAISQAQTKLDAAKKRYQDALRAAEQAGVSAAPGTAPPEGAGSSAAAAKAEFDRQMASLAQASQETNQVRERATAGPLVGGERAGQVFGTMGLEEINREQLKTQRATLKANEKMITYLRNFSNRWMLEFQ
jgi:hypothetical protein